MIGGRLFSALDKMLADMEAATPENKYREPRWRRG